MSLSGLVLEQVEKRLPKVMDARRHGAIDYLHAAFFLGMALAYRRRRPRVAVAAAVTGGFLLTEALLTDYPMGMKKVIPFEVHGRIDGSAALASLSLPRILAIEGTAAAALFKGSGIFGATMVGLTDYNSERARAERERGRAEAA